MPQPQTNAAESNTKLQKEFELMTKNQSLTTSFVVNYVRDYVRD